MRRNQFELQPCLCRCGRLCEWHTFKPGHDARALAQVVADHYDGSARRFVLACGSEVPSGRHPWPTALKVASKRYGSVREAVLAHRS